MRPRCGATPGMHPCCILDVAGALSPPSEEAGGATHPQTEPGHPSLRSSSAPTAPSTPQSKKKPAEPIADSRAHGKEQPQGMLVGFWLGSFGS